VVSKQRTHVLIYAKLLHSQVWRNHPGIIDALLEGGADVDAQDGESGW